MVQVTCYWNISRGAAFKSIRPGHGLAKPPGRERDRRRKKAPAKGFLGPWENISWTVTISSRIWWSAVREMDPFGILLPWLPAMAFFMLPLEIFRNIPKSNHIKRKD